LNHGGHRGFAAQRKVKVGCGFAVKANARIRQKIKMLNHRGQGGFAAQRSAKIGCGFAVKAKARIRAKDKDVEPQR
jgi:hypothetical protein